MRKNILTYFFFLACHNIYGQQGATIHELLQKVESLKDSSKVKQLFEIANYYGGQMRRDSNKFYLNIAYEEAKKCEYKHGESRALLGLGYIFLYEGEHEKSFDFFQKSLIIKESLHLPLEAAAVKEAMGRLFLNRGESQKAISYFMEAKNTYELFTDSARLMPLLTEISGYYEKEKKYDTAVVYYQKVLKVYNEWEKNKKALIPPAYLANYKSAVLVGLSDCLIETGNAFEAITILEPLYEKRRMTEGAAPIILQAFLGRAYLKTGQFEKSAKTCEEAIKFLNNNPDQKLLDDLKILYECASEAYYATGQYKAAFENHKLFKIINDSIYSENNSNAIAEMEKKYETAKKDSQILSLNKEKKFQHIITALAIVATMISLGLLLFAFRSNKLQKKLFTQKELLLRNEKELETNALQRKMNELEQMALRAQMNPHFIFNSLNSVQHFVMTGDAEGVNRFLGAFAQLIRQTLDNSGKQFITLNEEIKYLETYLSLEKMKSNGAFSYSINIGENINSSSTLIPGMILQPFIENSLRHGFAQKESGEGKIDIRVSKNGRLVCLIEDNGIGRQKAGELKKSSAGAHYDSMGMAITMNRIETINKIYNTDISVQVNDLRDPREAPAGTQVKIEFPVDIE